MRTVRGWKVPEALATAEPSIEESKRRQAKEVSLKLNKN